GSAEDIQGPPGAATDLEDAVRPDEACGAVDDGIAAEKEAPAGGIVDAGVQCVVALQGLVRCGSGIHGRISAKWVLP
ncbi:MAG: hypothetical protein ACK56I_27675, partial [bacterium]